MEISPDEIADILEAINKLDCTSVEVTVGGVSIAVRRGVAPHTQAAPAAAPGLAALKPAAAIESERSAPTPPGSFPTTAPNGDVAAWLEQEALGTVHIVRAPMIGTFYSAKAPGDPPFIEVGANVQKGDTLGLMEVMKLFNSLIAEVAGTVEAIFARNGDMVEFDQPVIVIRTA